VNHFHHIFPGAFMKGDCDHPHKSYGGQNVTSYEQTIVKNVLTWWLPATATAYVLPFLFSGSLTGSFLNGFHHNDMILQLTCDDKIQVSLPCFKYSLKCLTNSYPKKSVIKLKP
jgi:hypothetical protein